MTQTCFFRAAPLWPVPCWRVQLRSDLVQLKRCRVIRIVYADGEPRSRTFPLSHESSVQIALPLDFLLSDAMCPDGLFNRAWLMLDAFRKGLPLATARPAKRTCDGDRSTGRISGIGTERLSCRPRLRCSRRSLFRHTPECALPFTSARRNA